MFALLGLYFCFNNNKNTSYFQAVTVIHQSVNYNNCLRKCVDTILTKVRSGLGVLISRYNLYSQ